MCVSVYVDDLNIIGTTQEIHEASNHLKTEFEMKDLGDGIVPGGQPERRRAQLPGRQTFRSLAPGGGFFRCRSGHGDVPACLTLLHTIRAPRAPKCNKHCVRFRTCQNLCCNA